MQNPNPLLGKAEGAALAAVVGGAAVAGGGGAAAAAAVARRELVPWRDTVRGPELTRDLLEFYYANNMHKTKPDQFKSVNDWWQWFIDMLQHRDLFKDFQLPSIKTLRQYIKETKAKVAAENRWTDANGTVRSNLSDHAGDLSPLAKVVQNILLDEEEAEATRDLSNKNQLAQELDRTEENVLTDCANGSAKRRRLASAGAGASAAAAGGGGASGASYATPRGGSMSASSILDQTIIDLLSAQEKG